MKFIKIGKLVNTHGLDGLLLMQVTTESPEILEEMQYMMLSKEGKVKASLEIEYMKDYKGMLLVGFKGLEDVDSALKYKGMDVVVPEEMLPQLDDEIYWHELEGCQVLDTNGDFVGTLIDYMEAGASEVFRIQGEKETWLISNNKDHVTEINVKEKKLVINREGLISEDV
ncbi:ribosome maturation factor RimM [Seleniivibrio woodruffii]|uniref:Ribosome maturation factor RimM n=1 Tax=Seleniivibrio woodruffii TaxID=1078050 RepID=A0A4V2PRT0_9BACT|nr:ribosome maturation factor RimM [Seleniivibrio woodruffii]TCK60001.1 16S rRNA processing protein RimM [Seleniivibrio woodruffii]TVZ35778.1 16S rRNA processing protein RimM [Seleniivibrio woodruffii]